MCGGGPKWKREVVADHKFDFVNVEDYRDKGFFMRVKYLWLYIIVLKSFLVYISDIFSAITMLTTKAWSNRVFEQCPDIDGCVSIPFDVGKWLFVGCIIFSFLLLAYESRKTKKIIASRDISYAFTNVMANNYYSLRSYDCFCFFDHISSSTKMSDDFAFFVFFVFKDWKRLLLADTPRQTINALVLYSVYLSKKADLKGKWWNVPVYFQGGTMSTSALLVTQFFTVAICAGSLLILGIAGLCYIPLLCHIRGNLKEYCCHIVDKRTKEIIDKKREERQRAAAREARGDFSHLKKKKDLIMAQRLAQPTLPKVQVDDDETSSMHTRVAPSTYTQDSYYYYQSDKATLADALPPMPAYNPYSTYQGPSSANGGYAQYNPSSASINNTHAVAHDIPSPGGGVPYGMYDDDNESTAHLTAAAAPFARDPIERQNSPYSRQQTPMQHPPPPSIHNYAMDPYSRQGTPAQGGGGGYGPQPQGQPHRRSPPGGQPGAPAAAGGYDDLVSDYYASPVDDSRQGYHQHQGHNGYGGGRGY